MHGTATTDDPFTLKTIIKEHQKGIILLRNQTQLLHRQRFDAIFYKHYIGTVKREILPIQLNLKSFSKASLIAYLIMSKNRTIGKHQPTTLTKNITKNRGTRRF